METIGLICCRKKRGMAGRRLRNRFDGLSGAGLAAEVQSAARDLPVSADDKFVTKIMRVVKGTVRLFFTSLATLALLYPTAARAQETTMATIKGEDAYTISGSTECGGKATSTIKPGERFIARELSYGKKDWAVYLRSGSEGTIPRNRIRVLPGEPLARLNFAGCKEKWRELQSNKRIGMIDDTGSQAKDHGVVHYYKTLLKASEGDVKAFAQFNSLTPFMDGAAGEGHSWYKWVLLHVAGDDTFAKLLAGQSSKVREEYATHFAGPETEPISNPKPYIKLHFPKTYSILYGK